MKTFNEFITESKDKVEFAPELDETLNPVKIVKRFNANRNLSNTHKTLSQKISNNKNLNFVSRAIEQGKLNDRMRKKQDAIKKKFS